MRPPLTRTSTLCSTYIPDPFGSAATASSRRRCTAPFVSQSQPLARVSQLTILWIGIAKTLGAAVIPSFIRGTQPGRVVVDCTIVKSSVVGMESFGPALSLDGEFVAEDPSEVLTIVFRQFVLSVTTQSYFGCVCQIHERSATAPEHIRDLCKIIAQNHCAKSLCLPSWSIPAGSIAVLKGI